MFVHYRGIVGCYNSKKKEKKLISTISVVSQCLFTDAMSTPQVGVQIGEIHNNDTGGGNVKQPSADLSNSSSSVPGSGYP